jgi:hypothetical protein
MARLIRPVRSPLALAAAWVATTITRITVLALATAVGPTAASPKTSL